MAFAYWFVCSLDFLFFLQISSDCSVTCITISVWTSVLRPFTTARRGAVSRARTTAGTAQARPTASSATRSIMSQTEPVLSWSVEKVKQGDTVISELFVLYPQCSRVRCDIENLCLTPVHPTLSHPHSCGSSQPFFCFVCLRGGGGPRLRQLHDLWGRLQEMCLV